jgi:hypothetical protein
MLKKLCTILLLGFSPLSAEIFACLNQSGFDLGFGNRTIDLVAQGNFCYESMDNNFKAYAARFGLNVEHRLVTIPYFKMFGMFGAFIEYENSSSALLSTIGNNAAQQAVFGFNVLVLRPEAIISPKISLYANITLVKYESGTAIGNNVWTFSFLSSSILENRDAVPEIGLKFYF